MRCKTVRGFTLIEVLCVIGLIMFMLAVLAKIAYSHRQNARIRSTQSLLARIEIGVNMYYGQFRDYPPDSAADPEALWKCLGRPLPVRGGGTFGPLLPFNESDLQNSSGAGIVVDAWRTPIVYRAPGQHNLDSVDLLSAGPDKKFADTEPASKDDISNWQRQR